MGDCLRIMRQSGRSDDALEEAKPVRIWYQSAVEMDGAATYRSALEAHFARTAEPATSVHLHGVDPGTWSGRQPSELMGYPAVFHAALSGPFLRNALRAEREGYDAFIIGTYIELYLREMRSLVDIPVISSLEAMLLVGCSVAKTLGIVTLNRELESLVRSRIEHHRLESRIETVLVVEPGLTEVELTRLLSEPKEYLDRFTRAARDAVNRHADAIIPAEGFLAEVVASNGLVEIDGATIMDGIAVPVAYAEMMIKLRRRTALSTERRWSYRRPPEDVISSFEERWRS